MECFAKKLLKLNKLKHVYSLPYSSTLGLRDGLKVVMRDTRGEQF